MDSHWEKFPTLRAIDAAYLLAGMEPPPGLKGIRGAPALISNMLNLIADKTGAVALATMPEQRNTITQSEFQSLRVEFGIMTSSVVPLNGLTGAPFCEALQKPKYQETPEYQAEYTKARENLDTADELMKERKTWEAIPAVTVSELERKEQKIAALSASIDAVHASVFPTKHHAAPAQQADTVPAPALAAGNKRWTPAFTEEVANFRNTNGTKKTAEKYGISESRIRQKLPGKLPKPKGYSAFTQRF